MNSDYEMNQVDVLLARSAILRDSGDLDGALAILDDLTKKWPFEKAVLLSKGYFYWEYGDIQDALKLFKDAATLFPESRLCSLGLFHILWKIKRYDEAIEEAKRFTSVRQCPEYDELINDIRISMEDADENS